MYLDGKTAMVTGAGSGIGFEVAKLLLQEGSNVAACDINTAGLEQLANETAAMPGELLTQKCDIRNPDDMRALAETCVERFGQLDALMNVAGILRFSHSEETSLEEWQEVISINLTGCFIACQAALPHLKRSRGNIVNVSSTSALGGLAYGAAYTASKGGIISLTQTLAVEFAAQGVRVNCVCPGGITTPMSGQTKLPDNINFDLLLRQSPMTGDASPDQVAHLMLFLASDKATHINGEHIRIDGAMLS